jgi:deoxyhypusine synthase
MIKRFGKIIDNKDSVYYWCYKNKIPGFIIILITVFCPAITDGSIGDMIYFHSYKKSGLIGKKYYNFKINKSILFKILKKLIMKQFLQKKQGYLFLNDRMVILGGGVVKHHVCNANLMRNGADYTVFINTGQEYDGSDSGK